MRGGGVSIIVLVTVVVLPDPELTVVVPVPPEPVEGAVLLGVPPEDIMLDLFCYFIFCLEDRMFLRASLVAPVYTRGYGLRRFKLLTRWSYS